MAAFTWTPTHAEVSTYTVPAGINLLSIDARSANYNATWLGARAWCDMQVTPGDVLNLYENSDMDYVVTLGIRVSKGTAAQYFARAIGCDNGYQGQAVLRALLMTPMAPMGTSVNNIGPATLTITPKNNVTYGPSGSYTFTVPAGVTSVTMETWCGVVAPSTYLGGYAKADLAVVAGQILEIYVVGGVNSTYMRRNGITYVAAFPAGYDSYEGSTPGDGVAYAGTTNTTVQSNVSNQYKAVLTYEVTTPKTTPVNTTRSASWFVKGRVSANRTSLWDVLQTLTPISTVRTALWNVKTRVSTNRASLWDVARSLMSVSAQRTALWDIKAGTSTTRSSLWNVTARINAARSSLWNVFSSVATSRITTWDVKEQVNTTRSSLWDVWTSLFISRVTSWDVKEQVNTTRSSLWNLLSSLSTPRSVIWDVKEQVNTTRTSMWNLLTSLSTSRSAAWNVLSNTFATRSISWNVQNHVAAVRDATWNIDSEVSTTRYVRSNILNLVAIDRTVVWNARGRVSVNRHASWIVDSDITPHNVTITVTLLPRQWSGSIQSERRWEGKLL